MNYKILILISLMMVLVSGLALAVGTVPNNTAVVSYWGFDNNTIQADDYTGRFNGSITGALFNSSGILEGAYSYDGNNDRIVFGNNESLNPTSEITVGAWFNRDDVAPANEYIISRWGGGAKSYTLFYGGDGFMYWIIRQGGASKTAMSTTSINANTWYHVVGTFDGTTVKIYVDGVSEANTTAVGGIDSSTINTVTGSSDPIGLTFDGTIDEVFIANESYTHDNVKFLYNLGTPTINQQYPFGETSLYTVNTTQNPNNITVQTIGNLTINATITDSVGNISELINPSTILNWNIIAKGNYNCTIIYGYNNTCMKDNNTQLSMTKINNSLFTYSQDENAYLPSYYAFDEVWIETQTKSDYELIDNNVFKFQINNITTDTTVASYVEYNIDYQSLLFTDPLFVKFCFHNYTTGNILFGETCRTIDVLPVGTPFNHCHENNLSCHHVSRINPDIILENNNQSGYIAFGSTATVNQARWNARYTLNSTYDTGDVMFQTSNDLGITWVNTSNIFDVHLHQFANNDGINYSATFNNGLGTLTSSDYVFDNFDILNSNPSFVNIDYPQSNTVFTLNSTGTDIFFNWTNSTDADGDIIYYAVALGNGQPTTNLTTGLTVTNYTDSFTSSELTNGTHRTWVYSYDLVGGVSSSPANHTFFVCISNWVETDGPCVNNLRNVTYVDSNNCPLIYDKPSDYIEDCVSESTQNWLFLVVFMFIIIILIVLAFLVHPYFLGLAGLIMGVMTPFTFIPMLDNTLFVVLMFVLSGVFLIVSFFMGLKNQD